MKKNILLSGLVALLAVFSGCEMNEEPKSEASVDMVFSSENGLKTYTYSFYNVLPSRGSAFRRDATADYGVKNSLGGMEVGAYTTNSATSWSWSALRNINFFLENNVNESLSTTIRDNYACSVLASILINWYNMARYLGLIRYLTRLKTRIFITRVIHVM